jgi:hypothetical protein
MIFANISSDPGAPRLGHLVRWLPGSAQGP